MGRIKLWKNKKVIINKLKQNNNNGNKSKKKKTNCSKNWTHQLRGGVGGEATSHTFSKTSSLPPPPPSHLPPRHRDPDSVDSLATKHYSSVII